MEEKVLVNGIFPKNFGKHLLISLIGALICNIPATASGIVALSIPGAFFVVYFWLSLICLLCFSNAEITVTDKRIFGRAIFKQRVDLPIDKISSVGTCLFNGIGVATSSGRIKFLFCKNQNEVFEAISKLLLDRQEQKPRETAIRSERPQSSADELKKYKDLLDSGIITQDEFDAKKKQLLGL